MENLIQILIRLADVFSGHVNMILTCVTSWGILPGIDGIIVFAAGTVTYSNIPAEILAVARRWHGSINEKFDNIENLISIVRSHTTWSPPSSYSQIVGNRDQLATLIFKCRSPLGNAIDRGQRNILLKTTVGLCLTQMKSWAYAQYYGGTITINDVHALGFLLPGEASGHHARKEASDAIAEVKVKIISAKVIRVVIDQASGDNAAHVAHGWPPGVRHALIVITAADGKTEVLRIHTTRLYNNVAMPEGSHGKQFIIKAAFLRHVNDEPRFGPQPTFSMPLTTEDLVTMRNLRYYEDLEAHLREIDRLRREIEQLKTLPPHTGGS